MFYSNLKMLLFFLEGCKKISKIIDFFPRANKEGSQYL